MMLFLLILTTLLVLMKTNKSGYMYNCYQPSGQFSNEQCTFYYHKKEIFKDFKLEYDTQCAYCQKDCFMMHYTHWHNEFRSICMCTNRADYGALVPHGYQERGGVKVLNGGLTKHHITYCPIQISDRSESDINISYDPYQADFFPERETINWFDMILGISGESMIELNKKNIPRDIIKSSPNSLNAIEEKNEDYLKFLEYFDLEQDKRTRQPGLHFIKIKSLDENKLKSMPRRFQFKMIGLDLMVDPNTPNPNPESTSGDDMYEVKHCYLSVVIRRPIYIVPLNEQTYQVKLNEEKVLTFYIHDIDMNYYDQETYKQKMDHTKIIVNGGDPIPIIQHKDCFHGGFLKLEEKIEDLKKSPFLKLKVKGLKKTDGKSFEHDSNVCIFDITTAHNWYSDSYYTTTNLILVRVRDNYQVFDDPYVPKNDILNVVFIDEYQGGMMHLGYPGQYSVDLKVKYTNQPKVNIFESQEYSNEIGKYTGTICYPNFYASDSRLIELLNFKFTNYGSVTVKANHGMGQQTTNVGIMGHTEVHITAQQLENYPIFYYFNPNSNQKQGTKTFISYDMVSQKVIEQFDQIDLKVFYKNGVKDKPGELKFLEVTPVDTYIKLDTKMTQSQDSIFKMTKNAKLFIEPVSYPLPAYINSQITFQLQKIFKDGDLRYVESTSLQAHIYGICNHHHDLGKIFTLEPSNHFYIHNIEGTEFKYFLFSNGEFYKKLTLSIYDQLLPKKISTQFIDGRTDKNTKLTSQFIVQLDQDNQDPLTLLKPLANPNDVTFTSSIEFQTENKILQLSVLQIKKQTLSIKSKLTDLNINWYNYEGSKDTVIIEFDVVDSNGNSTDLNSDKAILEIKIEMPEEYLNADLIFDAAHLKAKKLVIKQEMFTRTVLPDYLNNIKAYVKLKDTVDGKPVLSKYRSNVLTFNIKFYFQKYMAIIPPSSKYFYCVTSFDGENVKTVDLKDYMIDNQNPTLSIKMNDQPVNNTLKVSLDGTVLKIDCTDPTSKSHEFKLEYKIGDLQTQYLKFSVTVIPNRFKLKDENFQDGRMCTFPYKKGYPCYVMREGPKQWHIYMNRAQQGHDILRSWDYVTDWGFKDFNSSNDFDKKGTLEYTNIRVNPNFGINQQQMYLQEGYYMVIPVGNFSQVYIQKIHSKTSVSFQFENTFTLASREKPHFQFYSLQNSQYSRVTEKDKQAPIGSSWVSPFIIYCKGIEDAYYSYLQIIDNAGQTMELLERQMGEHILKWTPSEEGKFTFKFRCYKLYKHFDDHAAQACDYSFKICRERTVTLTAINAAYLDYDGKQIQIFKGQKISKTFNLNKGDDDPAKNYLVIKNKDKTMNSGLPSFGMFKKQSDGKITINMVWDTQNMNVQNYEILYSVLKRDNLNQYVNSQIRLQVLPNNPPEILDKQTQQVNNIYIGHSWEASFKFKDDDGGDHITKIELDQIECGYDQQKITFSTSNIESDSANKPNHKDILKLTIGSVPDRNNKQDYSTCHFRLTAYDSRQLKGEYKFILTPKLKYDFEILNSGDNKVAYGCKKTVKLQAFYIINGARTNVHNMVRIGVEVPDNFPGQIQYIYDRQLQFQIIMLDLGSLQDNEYTLKIKLFNIQYHNWEEIFVSHDYKLVAKQLKDFTFDYPDTVEKQKLEYGNKLQYALNPVNNKDFNIEWRLENGPLDQYKFENNNLIIECQNWKMNQQKLMRNMVVKGVIKFDDSEHVVQKDFKISITKAIAVSNSLEGQTIQVDPGVTFIYRLKISSGHYPSDLKFQIKDGKGLMTPQISASGNIKISTSVCSSDGQIQITIEDPYDYTGKNILNIAFTLKVNLALVPSPKLIIIDPSDKNWLQSQVFGNKQQYGETSQSLYKTAQYRSYYSLFVMDYQGGSIAADKMSITGINPDNTNQVQNLKIVEDAPGQTIVKECGGQSVKYNLFKIDWKPVGVYITSDIFSINYKTDTNKEANLPFQFYDIDQNLQQGDFDAQIIKDPVECPLKIKFGDVWKCQLYVDDTITSDRYTFLVFKWYRPGNQPGASAWDSFVITQYGESYFEGVLPKRGLNKITVVMYVYKIVKYYDKNDKEQTTAYVKYEFIDIVIEEHNSAPVYVPLSDGIITKIDETMENQTIYKIKFRFTDHEKDSMVIKNCYAPSHNYFNDTNKLQPLLNLTKQDPTGDSDSEVDYTYEKQNHLATQTGIILCDLVDTNHTNQVQIKLGISINPRCSRYPEVLGMGIFNKNFQLKSKQTFLKFMYNFDAYKWGTTTKKELKFPVRNIASKFIIHFGGMAFKCPSNGENKCTVGDFSTQSWQSYTYPDSKKVIFTFQSSKIPHIGYFWIENRKELSDKKLQENPNDEEQNTQVTQNQSNSNRTLTQSVDKSGGLPSLPSVPSVPSVPGVPGVPNNQQQAEDFQPADLKNGLIESGSSLTYIYGFDKIGINMGKTEYTIDIYDIAPNNYYRPKLKISDDDRDLIYEDKDNTIQFTIDFQNKYDHFQLNYVICVGFRVTLSGTKQVVDTSRYHLGYYMSQDAGEDKEEKQGSCLFYAQNYAFTSSDYHGLCVLLRYQYLQDFSKYTSHYKTLQIDKDCFLIDVVDKADQLKDTIQLASSQKLNYFGGNFIKFKYIKPVSSTNKYSRTSKSKKLRVNVGGHIYTMDIQSSSSYEYSVHAYTLNNNYQTDLLKLMMFASNNLNGMQYGYQKVYMFNLDYKLQDFIAGKYLDSQFRIQGCPAGFYCPKKININPPQFCVPGTYRAAGQGRSGARCEDCDNGYYCGVDPKKSISSQFSKVDDCPAGFICNYKKLGYLTKEIECPGGFVCPKGLRSDFTVVNYTESYDTSTNQISACRPGYYCYRRVQHADPSKDQGPQKCFDGFVCGSSEKFPHGQGICQKGFYCFTNPPYILHNVTDNTNSTVDTCSEFKCPCPKGFSCKRGSTEPRPCGKGFFANVTELDECHMCEEGHYCPYDRNVYQIKCPLGQFCPYSKTISPYDCQPNSYQDEEGQVACKKCPAGNTCPDQKMNRTQLCPEGYVCLQQQRPLACPPGFYCKAGTMNLPYYSPLITDESPQNIWKNFIDYKPSSEDDKEKIELFDLFKKNARDLCNVPSKSQYLQPKKVGDRYECPFGCPKGARCAMLSNKPSLCQVGQYQNEYYATDSCKLCEIGYSCQDEGIQDLNETSKYACQFGKICTTKGMTQQTEECPAGYYCGKMTDELNNFKILCPMGYYCPMGTAYKSYNPSDPKRSPKYCPKGTYSNREGLRVCEICIEGHQCDECGSENSIEIALESEDGLNLITSCINPAPCEKGTYRQQGGPIKCNLCPLGTYGPQTKQVSLDSCKKCEAGLICNKKGLKSQKVDQKYVKICDAGYYCEEGTSEATKIECPDGYVCPPGLKSRDEVEGYPCPPSRICKQGTKSTKTMYDSCLANYDTCQIGDPCEMNKFCPRLIGENNIKDYECPKGTESVPKSWKIEDCKQDKNAPNTDYLKQMQNENNDPWSQFDYIQDLVSLDELQLDTYQYKDFIFQLTKIPINSTIGVDYTLYMEYDDIDNPRKAGASTNVLNLVAVENQQPVALSPTPHVYYKNTTGLNYFRFRILANTRIKFKLKVGVFTGDKVFRENYLKWKNNYKLENMTEANYNISYSFLLSKNAIGSTSVFYDPANIQVNKGITNTELAQFQGKEYKFYKELMVTNIPDDFDSIMNKKVEYKENRKGQTLFSQNSNLDFHPFQYIPFISDCDEFGAYLPLWKILYLKDSDKMANSTSIEGNCTNLPFSETKPVEFFRPTNLPKTDKCKVKLTCRYADRLLVPGYDPMKFWMKYSDISKKYLMFISRNKYNKEQFRNGLNIGFNDPTRIEVKSVRNVEENDQAAQGRQVPQNVTLYLKFYQVNSSTQEILTANLYYGNFTQINDEYLKNPRFKFQITYESMTWLETLDNFGFEANYYFIFVIGVCLIIFLMIFSIWLFYHHHSNVTPIPRLKIKVFTSYSIKSLIGLSLSIIPICSLFILLRWILYKPNFISDLIKPIKSDYLVETAVDETKTQQGRLGIGLFTIGIFAIYRCINLLIPDIHDQYLDDQRKSTRVSANRENNKKKAYLYYSALLSISFGSIYNQFAKVPQVYQNMMGLEVGLYAGISNKIYQNTRAGFNDDLMALPMKGTFSLIQLMIAMKIDLFTVFLRGYLIQIGIIVFKKYVVNPTRIDIQDAIANFKKRKLPGAKSAQDLSLSLSRTRRIYQEQLNDLGLGSMEFLSSWIFVVLMMFQLICADELNIKISKDFLQYFVIFTFIQASAEIPYNIFINNGIECRTGRRVYELLQECDDIFRFRTKMWCLSDKSSLPGIFSPVPRTARSLQKMGFSDQYFFMNTLGIMGMICIIYSIDFWINKNYNPFRDLAMILIILFTLILCYSVQILFTTFGKYFKFWKVNQEMIDKIIQKRDQEYEIDLSIEKQIIEIFYNMDEKIKTQQRDIAINYIVCQLIQNAHAKNNNYEIRFSNLMKVFKKIEEFIQENYQTTERKSISSQRTGLFLENDVERNNVELQMVDIENNPQQVEKIKQNLMFEKNLQRKTFNRSCLLNFQKVNPKQLAMKQLESEFSYKQLIDDGDTNTKKQKKIELTNYNIKCKNSQSRRKQEYFKRFHKLKENNSKIIIKK